MISILSSHSSFLLNLFFLVSVLVLGWVFLRRYRSLSHGWFTENLRLKRENQLLQNLFPAIAQAPSFEAALDIAIVQVCEVTNWQVGEAWVPDPTQQYLECRAWYYSHSDSVTSEMSCSIQNEFQASALALHFAPQEGLPGRVWATQQSEWLLNVSDLPHSFFLRSSLALKIGLKSALGIPIIVQDQVLAILTFFMVSSRSEDQELVNLIRSIALQLGMVLQHKQTEAALRQTETQYRSIFENAIEGIFQTSAEGKYLQINPSLAQIYGYDSCTDLMESMGDISGQLYVQPQRRQEFIELMQTQGIVSQFESQVYRKNGEVIWIAENARAVRDESGDLLYYEGTVEDITERKNVEESLQKSEAKNRALLNVIPDVIFRLDREGFYLDLTLSSTGETLFDCSPASIIGRNISEILPIEISQKIQGYIEETLATRKISVFEYQWFVNQKLEDYEMRIVMSDVNEVLAIVRDITERKKMERMKNEFVSMVSHELRTPLTSIKGSLGLITGGVVGEIPAPVKSLVDIAFKNCERLVLLINDILDIEKIESGKMNFQIQSVPLLPLIEQAIVANRIYAEQFQVRFQLETTISSPWVNVDSDRLMQVLANLLSNAAKFSPPQETVTIRITHPNACWVRVSVEDRGLGIPDEFRSRIFQKFAQADSSDTRQKGGTGLGLSISKAIIEKFNGKIGFFTPETGGTIFYFDLPNLLPQQSLPCALPSTYPILICEDDPDIATLLHLMLKQGGFEADIAHSASEAKACLSRKKYGAMTLDLALPGQDGISLIRELRQQTSTATLAIIVVSAKAQQGREALSGNSFQVLDWLDKPIDQNRLITVLSQALNPRSADKPRILHVENDRDILQVVAMILQETADIVQALDLQMAEQQLRQESFALVILDLDLPDGSGLELLPLLYTPAGMPIPVVIFSAQDDRMDSIHQVSATLVKARTSNQGFLETITSLITGNSQCY